MTISETSNAFLSKPDFWKTACVIPTTRGSNPTIINYETIESRIQMRESNGSLKKSVVGR